MNSDHEKRQNVRIGIHLKAQLESVHKVQILGTCTNLSARGLYFECDQKPEEKAKVELVVYLGDSRYTPSIHLQGIVVRKDEKGVGIQFTGIDFKDYELLKNVIVYSATDPEAAEKEFKRFLSLYRIRKPKIVPEV